MDQKAYRSSASSFPLPADTPLKRSSTITTTGARTRAAEVLKMVKTDIDSSCHVAETEPLIHKIFPVDQDDVTRVFNILVENNTYDTTKQRWKDLPVDEKKESKYYKPFVQVAEAIRKAYGDDSKIAYRSMWLDRHSLTPKSHENAAALIRPDVLNILGMTDDVTKWDDLMNTSDPASDKHLEAIVAWWLRVNVVVEIKPVEDQDILTHIYQLMGYLRQVLREQLDRRFVPGLLLSRTHLAVWVADRSGILGTHTSFDIHKNPMQFIRVILGCSILPPARLGWDTTMRLCRNPRDPSTYIHSFSRNVDFETYTSSVYTRHWVIEMPSKDGKKTEEFVTTGALSVAKAESMQGRATIVWTAWKVEDLSKPGPYKIYVLKQSWRPKSAIPEAELYPPVYEAETHNIGRVYSSGDVTENGSLVDTEIFVRCGLPHLPPPVTPERNSNGKREGEQLDNAQRSEPYLVIATISDQLVFDNRLETAPNWRVQTRLVLEDYGWPLHHFRDSQELIRAVRDIVQALEFLYHKKGVLQRDISIGNILICPADSGPSRGRLIDLDYAKQTADRKLTLLSEAKAAEIDKIRAALLQVAVSVLGEHLSEDASRALVFDRKLALVDFCLAMKAINPRLADVNPISPRDLGFLEDVTSIPDYSSRKAQTGPRSATFPFASSEVLTKMRMFSSHGYLDDTNVPHDAIHDLEALFWCMTYICVTRDGPGGRRREELQPENVKANPAANMNLRRINYCFFASDEEDVLAYNKSLLFKANEYQQHVVEQFHPYFDPLKPLMTRWWHILRTAYQFPIFEASHGWILDALNGTLQGLESQDQSTPSKATAQVDSERRENLNLLRFGPENSTNEASSRDKQWDLSPSNDFLARGADYRSNAASPPSPTPTPTSKKSKTSHESGAGPQSMMPSRRSGT